MSKLPRLLFPSLLQKILQSFEGVVCLYVVNIDQDKQYRSYVDHPPVLFWPHHQ